VEQVNEAVITAFLLLHAGVS